MPSAANASNQAARWLGPVELHWRARAVGAWGARDAQDERDLFAFQCRLTMRKPPSPQLEDPVRIVKGAPVRTASMGRRPLWQLAIARHASGPITASSLDAEDR